MGGMFLYFLLATPAMMDDGNHYEGFTEALAQGKLDFKSFYGFHGLSILSVLVFWLTGSKISIIITSTILYLFSLPLAYFIGRDFYPTPSLSADRHKGAGLVRDSALEELRGNKTAGLYFMVLILLMPYVYTTMLRGFQEAALLFFILLVIYGSINKKLWTPIAWSFGGIVKPFALVLFSLFVKDFLPVKRGQVPFLRVPDSLKIVMVLIALIMGLVYLGASYYQTGHLVNNAAINSYEGNFNTGNPPPLVESFTIGVKGFLRVGANLLLHYRKILLSPLVVILGGLALWNLKKLRLRREIILAILLNIFLVGSLTFSFSKYLLPMVVLLALVSVSYLLKYRWLILLVVIDSYFVFIPLWNYYQTTFWSNRLIYYMPIYLSLFIILFSWRKKPSF